MLAKGLGGWVQKMEFFTDYCICAHIVDGSVWKSPKICWRSIGMFQDRPFVSPMSSLKRSHRKRAVPIKKNFTAARDFVHLTAFYWKKKARLLLRKSGPHFNFKISTRRAVAIDAGAFSNSSPAYFSTSNTMAKFQLRRFHITDVFNIWFELGISIDSNSWLARNK